MGRHGPRDVRVSRCAAGATGRPSSPAPSTSSPARSPTGAFSATPTRATSARTPSTAGRSSHHGRIPYRDFYDEYPPGSVPVFALPALIWDAHYVLVFKLLMTACGLGFTVCAAWTVRRLGLSAWRLAPIVLAPVLMGPVFLNRYDPLPALLVSLALVALLRGQERLPGALLGVGTALKLYPVRRRCRSRFGACGPSMRAGIAYVVAGAVLVLPFFALAPGGVGFSLWTQLKRHLQIESLGASILLAGSKLGIHHVGWIRGKPGSIDIGGRLADSVGVLSSVLALALVVAVAWAFWRGPDDDERHGDRLGGGDRRVRDLREGALAPVPHLARPARPSRRGKARAAGGDPVVRRARDHPARVPRRPPRPARPELERLGAARPKPRPGRRCSRCCSRSSSSRRQPQAAGGGGPPTR